MRSLFWCLLLGSSLILSASAQTNLPATASAASSSEISRVEVGSISSYIETNDFLEGNCSLPHWAFGPEVTVNVNRHVAVDGQLHILANSAPCMSFYKGGHSIQGLVGPRYSVRDGRTSYFGTAKVGFVRWNRALAGQPTSFADAKFESHTLFALHFGGGVEFAATKKIRLRAEVGDTILRNTYIDGSLINHTNNLQMVFGTHYAFGSTLPGRERGTSSEPTHKFFDKPNIFLHSLTLAGILADGIQTQTHLSDWCATTRCRSWNEADPLTRPLVKYGWSGQIALTGITAGSELFISHRLHRTGHHRLERIVPIAVAIGGAYMAYHWTGAHGLTDRKR